MRSYPHALALSILTLLTGAFVGYVFHNTTGVNILKTVEVVVESPMFKMTEARVRTVEEVVVTVAGSTTQNTIGLVEPRPEIKILSKALGIFFTNFVTCYGAALTPLIPLLYHRYITPLISEKLRRVDDPWKLYKYTTPLVPVAVLWFNGFTLYMILILAKTLFTFIPFETAALLAMSSVGLKASLNSEKPEDLEKSYEGFWRIALHATLLLLIAAFMESLLLSEEVIRFG